VSNNCEYQKHRYLQTIISQIAPAAGLKIMGAQWKLIRRFGQWQCVLFFCLYQLPICHLWIRSTESLVNYDIYKTANGWHFVHARCNVLFIQHLRASIIVWMMIWTCWLSYCQIETRPSGKAESGNILALFRITQLKMICLATRYIVPSQHLFINQYLQATAHYSCIIHH
jgi:hypothetical protein